MTPLEKNIDVNGCSDKVVAINAALASVNGTINIDGSVEDSTIMIAKNQDNGEEIMTVTLQSLIKRYEIVDAVLKIDCEGCEYEIFENLNYNDLMIFESIWIEYHRGLELTKDIILSKLERANFKTNVIKKEKKVGYIIAFRNTH